MAPRAASASRFRGGGRGAVRWATLVKTTGGAAAGADGPIFASGVLRPFALLLCRTHAYGQRVYAKRLAAIRAFGCHVRRDAGHGKAFLEERSEARTPTEGSGFRRRWNANHLAAAQPACAESGGDTSAEKRFGLSGENTHNGHDLLIWNRVCREISADVESLRDHRFR